jgi:multicomponent Na+:H+ antiporter subunit G
MAGMIIAIALIVAGVFFLTVSALGLLRLPDFYARTHAVGKSETLGSILTLSGLAVYNGLELSTVKILFILVFVLVANPTATHAIARAALRTGLQPWTGKKAEQKKKGAEPS